MLYEVDDIDTTAVDIYGHNAIMNSIFSMDPYVLRMISAFINPDLTDKEGNSCLHIAAALGSYEMTSICLDELKVNQAKNIYGQTPLCFASSADVVELLILNGAEMNEKDDFGWTPLHHAIYNNLDDCARVLIQIGAEILSEDDGNLTVLDMIKLRDQNDYIVKLIHEEFEKKRKSKK